MQSAVLCLALAAALLPSALQQCLTPNDGVNPTPKGKNGLYSGQQDFSLAMLQAINQLQPSENLFFSPYSTYHALLLAYFISANQTEAYLKRALRLDDALTKADVYPAYKLDKYATEVRSNRNSYELTNAHKIYVAKNVSVRECLTTMFQQELQKMDFAADPEAARNEINSWVESKTHRMIKDLLPAGSIDKLTNLVLVNAAYFKGIWENKFDPAQTRPEVFYITPSKQTMVDMMHVEATFNHEISEDLMAHILELPYQGGDISMFILLPPFTKADGIETILKRLTREKFKAITQGTNLDAHTVQVGLPKFSLEHTLELVPILNGLGVGNLFQPDADLSVLTGMRELTLDEAIHKAKIKVDEKGTQAAGATSFFTWRMNWNEDDEPVTFKCDRPFLFFLYHKIMNTVLFVGVYRSP